MVSDISASAPAAWPAGLAIAKSPGEAPADRRPATETQAARTANATSVLHAEHARAQAAVERRLEQAADLGRVAQRLRSVQEKLNVMHERLEGIVKRYPPYPQDNPERIERLNQVTGLRKQIEELLLPLEREGLVHAGEKEAVARFPMRPLDPLSAHDGEVAAALEEVGWMRGRVEGLQQRLWSDLFEVNSPVDEPVATSMARAAQAQLADTGQPIGVNRDKFPSLTD